VTDPGSPVGAGGPGGGGRGGGPARGELDEARSRMVSRHLKLCTECWRKAVAFSRVMGLLLEGEWSEPPPGLARRTIERCTAHMR